MVRVSTRWWWWKLLLRAHVGVVARLTALEACDSRALKWWPWLSHDNPLRLSRVGRAGSEAWRSLGMRNPSDSTFWHPNAALLRGKDQNAIDNEGNVLPKLVYMAREKRPQHHHNFKAGAMNALVHSLTLHCHTKYTTYC